MHRGRKHRPIDLLTFIGVGFLIVCTAVSCEQTCYDGEQNQAELGIDCGGNCVPCDTTGGTCFDGLLNQGETDIDCGGPCSACISDTSVYDPDYLCHGNNGNSYFPQSVGSYWIYELPSNQWFMYEMTEQVTLSNSEDYHHVVRTSPSGTSHFYVRESGGQTYRWFASSTGVPVGVEEIYIPSSPSTGQEWTTATMDSIIIDNADMSFLSNNGCQYDNVLAITYYSSGVGLTDYFKQGVGLIQQGPTALLDSLVIF